MAGDTIITVVGNLTHDPELRFTPSGAAVASFTIASTPRTYDRQSGEWKDGDALFMRCSLWRDAAENVAESLTKGMRVIAQGRLVQRSYTTREGEQRTVVEMQVDEIGPSLRYAKAQVTRNSRGGGNYGGNNAGASNGGGYGGSHELGRTNKNGSPQIAQRLRIFKGKNTSPCRRHETPCLLWRFTANQVRQGFSRDVRNLIRFKISHDKAAKNPS